MSVGCLNGTAGQLRNRNRQPLRDGCAACVSSRRCANWQHVIHGYSSAPHHVRWVSRIGAMPDDELTALVRAIAWELIQLGYVPTDRPGFVQRGDREPVRLVATETWRAMQELLQGAQP